MPVVVIGILILFFMGLAPIFWFLKSLIGLLIMLVVLAILVGVLALVMKKVHQETGQDGTEG